MPGKIYSKPFLYNIRNNIEIRTVIADLLNLQFKISDGYFRFFCPLCKSFNTATDKRTNLARCFDCKTNFNTIDIVMLCKRLDFIEAVNLLKTIFNIKEI